jgi:hypothetical protein
VSKNKNKKERINDGCNRSLNVFQLKPPFYYKTGVCWYKWEWHGIYTLSMKSERNIQHIDNEHLLPCIANL